MQISYTGSTFNSLCDVVNYVEAMNTLGAGVRWLNRFETFLSQSLVSPAGIKLCNNLAFYELGLRCINFNDWVIAFSIAPNGNILIEAVLHSSRLTD